MYSIVSVKLVSCLGSSVLFFLEQDAYSTSIPRALNKYQLNVREIWQNPGGVLPLTKGEEKGEEILRNLMLPKLR